MLDRRPTPPIDDYFMGIAMMVQRGSPCPHRPSGVIIVTPQDEIVAAAYTTSFYNDNLHAEFQAIMQAKKRGITLTACRLYATSAPCDQCFKVIQQELIFDIIYPGKAS